MVQQKNPDQSRRWSFQGAGQNMMRLHLHQLTVMQEPTLLLGLDPQRTSSIEQQGRNDHDPRTVSQGLQKNDAVPPQLNEDQPDTKMSDHLQRCHSRGIVVIHLTMRQQREEKDEILLHLSQLLK